MNSEHESIHPTIKSTRLRVVPMSKKPRRELTYQKIWKANL